MFRDVCNMITLYTGPMGAAKSASLINLAEKHTFVAFSPSQDTRNGCRIASRDGRSIPAIPVSSLREIMIHIYTMLKEGRRPEVFLIDEIHFLCRQQHSGDKDQWLTFALLMAMNGINMAMAGINLGHLGNVLEPVKTLIDATQIEPEKVHCVLLSGPKCHHCENTATYQWLVEDLQEPIPGDLGKEYLSMCTAHFRTELDRRITARNSEAHKMFFR